MKVKITTTRKPWADGQPRNVNEEVDVSEADAVKLIEAGLAREVDSDPREDVRGQRPDEDSANAGRGTAHPKRRRNARKPKAES